MFMTVYDKPREPVWRVYRRRLLVIGALGVAAIAGLLCLPPLPQPQSYHHFADDRTLLGAPNLLNV
ncbi:MAG: hypothetical protein ACRELG_02360, partial [Gemmataceae bacterium]